MRIILTGDLGFSVDAEEVFGELDVKLLIATALLVLFLLGAIYRAVLVALTPLVVVFFAYTVATAFVYLYADSGATVSSNGTSILIVLMFGITTDYCLLLVSRYREELHWIEDKHDAMARAVSRTGPDDPRLGADRRARDAHPHPRRRAAHGHARARGGDRRLRRHARRADAAAGAAHDLRPQGILAALAGRWSTTPTPRRSPARACGGGSATRCWSAPARRSRSRRSCSSRARSGCSPGRWTTRPRTSSRSPSSRSRASS